MRALPPWWLLRRLLSGASPLRPAASGAAGGPPVQPPWRGRPLTGAAVRPPAPSTSPEDGSLGRRPGPGMCSRQSGSPSRTRGNGDRRPTPIASASTQRPHLPRVNPARTPDRPWSLPQRRFTADLGGKQTINADAHRRSRDPSTARAWWQPLSRGRPPTAGRATAVSPRPDPDHRGAEQRISAASRRRSPRSASGLQRDRHLPRLAARGARGRSVLPRKTRPEADSVLGSSFTGRGYSEGW